MKRKILTLVALSSISLSAFAQSSSPQSNSDIEVTAVVDAGCDLTADNINFGVLMMPLSDVKAANSYIHLKCSKGAALTLDIDYSNTGSLLSSQNYTVTSSVFSSRETNGVSFNFVNYKIYLNGVALSSDNTDFMCSSNRGSVSHIGGGRERVDSQVLANLLGVQIGYQSNLGLCDLSQSSSNGYKDAKLASVLSVSIGVLNGLTSGEQIKYYLENPNNTEQWSNGYVINATGEEQSIPMKANIKRADNATHRLTPDTYQSTLSVILTY